MSKVPPRSAVLWACTEGDPSALASPTTSTKALWGVGVTKGVTVNEGVRVARLTC